MYSLAPLILLRKDPWVVYVTPTIAMILLPISYQYQLSLARYDNTADLFSICHPGGLSIFTRRDNGLYVCNFGYPHVFVSTISEKES